MVVNWVQRRGSDRDIERRVHERAGRADDVKVDDAAHSWSPHAHQPSRRLRANTSM